MKRLALVLVLAQSFCAFGAAKIEDLKMRKRFGVGVSAGGPLSVMGLEFDVNVSEEVSLSGGMGTGLDYRTIMMKSRFFLLGERVSPYLAMGIARWWTQGTRGPEVGPSVLANRFLGGVDPRNGFDVVMLTPAMGVQFLHPMGLAVFAEIYYLFKLVDFSNGTYAALGIHWYF